MPALPAVSAHLAILLPFPTLLWELWERRRIVQPTPPAARTIARMPALSASGRLGHASTTAASSGSHWPFPAPSAPDLRRFVSRSLNFPSILAAGSNPAPAIFRSCEKSLLRANPQQVWGFFMPDHVSRFAAASSPARNYFPTACPSVSASGWRVTTSSSSLTPPRTSVSGPLRMPGCNARRTTFPSSTT